MWIDRIHLPQGAFQDRLQVRQIADSTRPNHRPACSVDRCCDHHSAIARISSIARGRISSLYFIREAQVRNEVRQTLHRRHDQGPRLHRALPVRPQKSLRIARLDLASGDKRHPDFRLPLNAAERIPQSYQSHQRLFSSFPRLFTMSSIQFW